MSDTDIKMSECCTCGTKWRTGQDGRHSCTQKMESQIKELEFSLDDRDCYIADADMKNEALTKQVTELREALLSIKSRQQVLTPSGFEFSSVWQIADKALKGSE